MTTLTYKGYTGTVDVDFESGCLFGKVLFISDAVVYQGSTPEELKTTFETAIDDYLADCAEFGKNPDKPFSGSFNVRIEPAMHKALAQKAAKLDTTLNAITVEAISAYLDEKPKEVKHIYEHKISVQYSPTEIVYGGNDIRPMKKNPLRAVK